MWALGACGGASDVPDVIDSELVVAEMNATVGALIEAMNDHDAERVLSFYAREDGYAHIGCTSVDLGFEQNAAIIRLFNRSSTDVTFDMEIVDTRVLTPASGVVLLRGKTTDADVLLWTLVFVKNAKGDWKLVHEHESWPDCPAPGGPHPYTSGP